LTTDLKALAHWDWQATANVVGRVSAALVALAQIK
jgi:hypothetical protein